MEIPRFIITTVFILLATLHGTTADEERPCNVAYRCSSEENPVWATDGKTCYVFRNECILLSTNCDRENSYLPKFTETTREKCRCLCNAECPKGNDQVCGYYNDEKRTFASQCEMDRHNCQTGETYSLFTNGPCA